MALFTVIQPVNLRDQIVEQIRVAIIDGDLQPGDHIIEADLTEKLGVSRTPVREALILLDSQKLVGFVPNRGCFVRTFDERDVEEIFSMRTLLENFAAELILPRLSEADFFHQEGMIKQQAQAIEQGLLRQARRIDMAFHRYFVELSDHRILINNWAQIVAQIAAFLNARAAAMPDFDERQAIIDHTAILEAYHSRDLNQIKATNARINAWVAEKCKSAVKQFDV